MKKNVSYQIGQHAEEIASSYLKNQGLALLHRNYRCYSGEIDLIMQDKADIVFVEVRNRGRQDYGTALESITRAKQKKLCKTAIHFLQLKKWLYKINSRFDVIVIQGKDFGQIEWIKHAFEVQTYL